MDEHGHRKKGIRGDEEVLPPGTSSTLLVSGTPPRPQAISIEGGAFSACMSKRWKANWRIMWSTTKSVIVATTTLSSLLGSVVSL